MNALRDTRARAQISRDGVAQHSVQCTVYSRDAIRWSGGQLVKGFGEDHMNETKEKESARASLRDEVRAGYIDEFR